MWFPNTDEQEADSHRVKHRDKESNILTVIPLCYDTRSELLLVCWECLLHLLLAQSSHTHRQADTHSAKVETPPLNVPISLLTYSQFPKNLPCRELSVKKLHCKVHTTHTVRHICTHRHVQHILQCHATSSTGIHTQLSLSYLQNTHSTYLAFFF